jgi:hypothetical protein
MVISLEKSNKILEKVVHTFNKLTDSKSLLMELPPLYLVVPDEQYFICSADLE